jgi:predicted enzyme related to lactoylglutathione lyase
MATPICHLEINVKNLPRAKKFYGRLMGWKFKAAMPGYLMTNIGKNVGCALSKGKTGSKGMLPYFHVTSIEKILKNAKGLRAKIVMPKTDIGGGHGFMAQIRDSEGNTIGIWNMR